MTVIQIGAIASALLAIVALITKLWNVINAIYALIYSLEQLKQTVKEQQVAITSLVDKMARLDWRVMNLEETREYYAA
ncbi:hypothetical protein JXA27_00590 [Aerococcaceae bacterium zg-B36]|uniref:hypothetical protein n=1 Tax=Aerococcaceae bacterium zg-252 TaxID=2796928 RepID=UPI001BD8D1DD|nr:hypothetical protein [Aerococcaceae bacterium zg-B36]